MGLLLLQIQPLSHSSHPHLLLLTKVIIWGGGGVGGLFLLILLLSICWTIITKTQYRSTLVSELSRFKLSL